MLSTGVIKQIRSEAYQDVVTLQLNQVEPLNASRSRFKCMVTDGSESVKGVLASQLNDLVNSGGLQSGAVVRLPGSGYSANTVGAVLTLMISELEVLQQGDTPVVGDRVEEAAAASPAAAAREPPAALDTPEPKKAKLDDGGSSAGGGATAAGGTSRVLRDIANGPGGAVAATQAQSRFAASGGGGGAATPGPAPSPSEEVRGAKLLPKTPGAHSQRSPSTQQPPSQQSTPGLAGRKAFTPIAALHPYDDQWVVRAKLVRKYPPRTINGKGGESKLLSVELVDDSGVAIQGTFWRLQAERQAEVLQEGKIYIISKFQVKPANKAFSGLKNDYEISFTDRTEVVEAADQDGSAMQAQLDLVPIDNVIKFVNRKTLVDVLGVVLNVGAVSSIKRKADNLEIPRRDVTLGDKSGRSVVLTLWGDHALNAELDNVGGDATTVMLCTSLKVSDYNGCSMSTLSKSSVALNPSAPLAVTELADWYDATGRHATFTPLSDGANRSSGGGLNGESSQLSTIKKLPSSMGADDKPEYHTMLVSVAQVKEDQQLYYTANPENGKKVVERDGRYWSEADSKYVDVCEWRYVLSFRAIDATGIAYLNVFNKEGEALLGVRAEEVADLKENNPAQLTKVLKDAAWREWCVTTASKGREYNGEVKVRHTITSLRPVDYVADCQKLVNLINAYA